MTIFGQLLKIPTFQAQRQVLELGMFLWQAKRPGHDSFLVPIVFLDHKATFRGSPSEAHHFEFSTSPPRPW